MGEESQAKQATEQKPDRMVRPKHWRFHHGRRSGILRSVAINLAVILIPVLAYYVIVVRQHEQYRHERALRAIGEVAQSFDERMATLSSLFRTAPRDCKPAGSNEDLCKNFEKHLVDSGWDVDAAKTCPLENAQGGAEPERAILNSTSSIPTLELIKCPKEGGSQSIKSPISSLLSSSLANGDLDEVLVASESGDVLAAIDTRLGDDTARTHGVHEIHHPHPHAIQIDSLLAHANGLPNAPAHAHLSELATQP